MEAGPPLSLGMDTPRQRPGGQTHVQGAPRVLLFWNMFPPPVAMWTKVLAVRFLQSGLSLNDSLGGSVLDVTFAQSGMPTLSPCHCGQLRAGQRGHRKGRRWCGPAGGWTAGATGRAWELGAGEDPVRRAQGSEQRWRGARESARSPCGCWMSTTGEGRLRASVSHLCLGRGRKAPGDWGSWPQTTRPGVCRSGCGPGQALPRGSESQAVERDPTPSGLPGVHPGMGRGQGERELGSVPSELGRRKEPGPRGSCEDMEGSWGAGAGPEKPSGSLIPAPSLGQRSPIWGCSSAGISQLFISAEAPRGACGCVCVFVHACTRVCMGAIHEGSGVCMCR